MDSITAAAHLLTVVAAQHGARLIIQRLAQAVGLAGLPQLVQLPCHSSRQGSGSSNVLLGQRRLRRALHLEGAPAAQRALAWLSRRHADKVVQSYSTGWGCSQAVAWQQDRPVVHTTLVALKELQPFT